MSSPRPPRRVATTAVSLAAAFALTAAGGAAPAVATPATDYPTWAEVQAAKRNEAAKRAEIAKLESLVHELQIATERLGIAALQRAEEAQIAQAAADDAATTSARLARQLESAEHRAADSARLAAGLVARLARSGAADASTVLAFSSQQDAEELLARLSTMSRVSESSAALLRRALFDKRTLDALSQEATVAEAERTKRADAARDAFDEARVAVEAAEAQVQRQASSTSVLYAQLAALKGTSADLEKRYYESAGSGGSGGSSGGSNGGGSNSGGNSGGSGGSSGGSNGGDSGGSNGGGSNGGGSNGGGSNGGGNSGGGSSGGGSNPTPTPTPSPSNPTTPTPGPPVASAVAGAIEFAKKQLGKPYALGGAGPNSWDCSGLVKQAYASVGVYIGAHGSTSQYNYLRDQGRLVKIANIQAGDLLFYSTGGSTTATKYHVTLYLGGGQMLEAPYPGVNVRITSMRTLDLVPYAARPTG